MTLPTLEQLPQWACRLLEEERVGHLGLIDDAGGPRVLPVSYALHDGAAWTAVDNKPKQSRDELARVRWLRQRPTAALTVDHYDDDWSRLRWVQLVGEVVIHDGPPTGPVLAALTQRYAQYERDPPPGPLLQLLAARAVCWRAA